MLKTSSPTSAEPHLATQLLSLNESSGWLNGFASSHLPVAWSPSSTAKMFARSSGATIASSTESEQTLFTCSTVYHGARLLRFQIPQ